MTTLSAFLAAPPVFFNDADASTCVTYSTLYREYLELLRVSYGNCDRGVAFGPAAVGGGLGTSSGQFSSASGGFGDASARVLSSDAYCASRCDCGRRLTCPCEFGRDCGASGGRSAAPGKPSDAGDCVNGLRDTSQVSSDVPVVTGGAESFARTSGSHGLGRVPGRWAASNKRKKEIAKAKKLASPSWRRVDERASGRCETVVSGATECPSYDKALSDAEREARDTLAQRRAAENKVARKLAEMKLASLEDEKKCQEYADLKHQRIIQWTNEATAKSQQSLDKVKSIDPSSSASQYEIRQQAKKLADSESENRRLCSIIKDVSPDWQELIERKAESTFNTEYVDELMALGEAGRDNGFGY